MIKKALFATIALAIGAIVLSGCVPTTTSGDVASQQSINLAMEVEPPNTDPIETRNIAAWNIYYALYDGLTRITGSGEIIPGLAESWEYNDDLTVWDFTIRSGVTFHDGSELKPSDVVYTYQSILDSDTSTNLPALGPLTSVEETGDGVVRFTFSAPFSAWLNQAATIGIVPESVYSDLGADFVDAPVGTGPYKFVSWTRGVTFQMTRNDDYWDDEPAVKDVTFSFVGAEDARVSGVQSGTLDAALISPNQIDALEGSANIEIVSGPSNQVVLLGMNSQSGALADVKVRQAISSAIDRQTLIDTLLAGRGTPTGQLVTKGVQGYAPSIQAPEYDPDHAKELLAEAGYAGEEITFDYATSGGDPMSTEVAQAIQGYLQDAGLNVKLIGSDQASLSLKFANSEITGLYLEGWAPSSMDGDVVVNQLLAGGPEDYAKDPALAALYAQQQAAGGDERAALFESIWQLNADQAYHLGIYANFRTFASSPELKWTPAVDGIYRAAEIALAD